MLSGRRCAYLAPSTGRLNDSCGPSRFFHPSDSGVAILKDEGDRLAYAVFGAVLAYQHFQHLRARLCRRRAFCFAWIEMKNLAIPATTAEALGGLLVEAGTRRRAVAQL
jgi:hypothetical protein